MSADENRARFVWPRWINPPLILLFASIGFAYFGFGSGFSWVLYEEPFRLNDYFREQAVAFSRGNTYLNRDNPLLDMSLYKGKIYLYWGPANALPRILEVLSGARLSPEVYTLAYLLGGLYLFYAMLRRIRQTHFPSADPFLDYLFLMGFAVGTPAVFLASRGALVYNHSIALSFLTQMLTFWGLLLVLENPRPRNQLLLGLGFAFSFATRATNVLLGLGLFVGVVLRFGLANGLRKAAWSLAPVIMVGVLLAWYNYARFDNPTEFGWKYASVWRKAKPEQMSMLRGGECFAFNSYLYLLRLPPLTQFPPKVGKLEQIVPPYFTENEKLDPYLVDVHSIFFLTPAVFMLLLGFGARGTQSARPLAFAMATMAGTMLLFLLFYSYASLRFFMDFLPATFVLLFIVVHAFLERHGGRRVVTTLLVVAFAWSALLMTQWAELGARRTRSALLTRDLVDVSYVPWPTIFLLLHGLTLWLAFNYCRRKQISGAPQLRHAAFAET